MLTTPFRVASLLGLVACQSPSPSPTSATPTDETEPPPEPQDCTVDGTTGVDAVVVAGEDTTMAWLTPRMEGDRVLGELDRVAGTGPWTVNLQHLWHTDCGDGLFAELSFEDVASPVSVEANGMVLTLDTDETDAIAVDIPMHLQVTRVSALGCGDRFEGEELDLTFELALRTIEPAWQLVPDAGAVLEGLPVSFAWEAFDTDGRQLQMGSPEVELRAIDGACLDRSAGPVAAFGEGSVEVRLEGALDRTLPVVAETEITGTAVYAGPDLVFGATATVEQAHGAWVRVDHLESAAGRIYGRMRPDDFTFAGSGVCSAYTGGNSDVPQTQLDVTTAGTCTLTVTHVPSGAMTVHTLQIED